MSNEETSGFVVEGQRSSDATPAPTAESQPAVEANEQPVNVDESSTETGNEDKPSEVENTETETTPQQQEGGDEQTKQEIQTDQHADETPDAAAGGKQKPRRSAQKRINKAIKAKAEAEARAERLEKELAELRETQSKAEDLKPPVEDDFEDYDDFLDAERDHRQKLKKAKAEAADKPDPVNDDNAVDQDFITAHKSVTAIIKEADNLPADFEEKTSDPDLKINQEMVKALAQTDAPQDVLYHLANNPQLASDIAEQSPTEALKSIYRIEFELSRPEPEPKPTPKPVQMSKAPEPIKPVSSHGTVRKSLHEMSESEYIKHMNEQERKARPF